MLLILRVRPFKKEVQVLILFKFEIVLAKSTMNAVQEFTMISYVLRLEWNENPKRSTKTLGLTTAREKCFISLLPLRGIPYLR